MADERTWTVRERCVDGSVRHVAVVEKSRLVALEAELTQRERERDEYQRRMVDALDSMEAHRANHNEAVERLGRAAAVLALIGTLGDVDADEAPSLARRVLAELEEKPEPLLEPELITNEQVRNLTDLLSTPCVERDSPCLEDGDA